MKHLILAVLFLVGCGSSITDSQAVGQVKRVIHRTPIICPNMTELDLSLGVMRNGVGSMSTQDLWFYVEDKNLVKVLEEAQKNGNLVEVTYDVKRIVFCAEDHQVTAVKVLEN